MLLIHVLHFRWYPQIKAWIVIEGIETIISARVVHYRERREVLRIALQRPTTMLIKARIALNVKQLYKLRSFFAYRKCKNKALFVGTVNIGKAEKPVSIVSFTIEISTYNVCQSLTIILYLYEWFYFICRNTNKARETAVYNIVE